MTQNWFSLEGKQITRCTEPRRTCDDDDKENSESEEEMAAAARPSAAAQSTSFAPLVGVLDMQESQKAGLSSLCKIVRAQRYVLASYNISVPIIF